MGVLDGFDATWKNARTSFGEGTPQTGEQFDASSTLNQMKSDMDAAAPGERWRGAAADAYGAVNSEHQRVIGEIANLDKRLAAQVNETARLVSTGRTDLEAVRQWVTDAAASVPPGKDRDRLLMPIVSKGLGQITEIIQNTHGQMNTVKGNLDKINAEYVSLGTDQRFAPKEGTGDQEMGPLSPEEQAKRDVEGALKGEEGAAKRVNDALSTIKPGQPLSPVQDAYLTQMQSQQKGMSVDDLSEAKDNLDANKNIIADSWQLMSNDDVYYSGAGEDQHGTASQLPDSVQRALQNADETYPVSMETNGLKYGDDLEAISQIVKDGDDKFQTGTELDRQIMFAADKVMDTQDSIAAPKGIDSPVTNLFEAVSPDHQIINDHMLGRNGADADDFLHDVNTTEWLDDGKAAGSLFSWTHEASTGSEAIIAGETAEKYASYIGSHPELMDIHNQTLGEYNPELVRAYSHGLTPYMSDIAGLSTDPPNNGFDSIETESSTERPVAKGIFSVLSTDAQAYNEFHSAANAQVVAASNSWAEDVKRGVDVPANDERMLDAQTLKALEAVGTTEAAKALNLNDQAVYKLQQEAYADGTKLLTTGAGLIPDYGGHLSNAIDPFAAAMQSSVIGDPPDTENYTIAPLDNGESARFALNALLANGVPLVDNTQGDFTQQYFELIDPERPELGYKPTILDRSGLNELGIGETTSERVLTQVIEDTLPDGNPTDAMKDQYDDTIANSKPNSAPEPGK